MVLILCLLLFVAAGYALHLGLTNHRLQEEALAATARLESTQQQLTLANAALENYGPVVDAELRAATLLRETRSSIERTRNEAHQAVGAVRAQATTQAHEAEERLAEAQKQATAILADADKRAQEIAGDALRARDDAKQVEATLKAMRHAVEGYGDLYLLPTGSFLDDLADEVGFSDVGHRLKAARDHVRSMITAHAAAICDEQNPDRRLLAIRFVLDAFNGKVDAILAEVRHDNFGTLEQKLRDAALLVNKNGQAFASARVLPEYVEARVAELKWAVAVHELKRRDREEQLTLKEHIRDEERAQREFERAMTEAEEEEDELRDAIERLQREGSRITRGQRTIYEDELAELNAKLIAAEEKSKRAMSTARQTKRGTIYVISNVGSFGENVFKIGMTRRLDPRDRINELGDASVPFPFDVHAFITADDAPALERELHRRFESAQVNKVNPRKDFFRASLLEIKGAVAELGCNKAIWTMAAECREYRESVALDGASRPTSLADSSTRAVAHVEAPAGAMELAS